MDNKDILKTILKVRNRTGAKVTECKAAVIECNGDEEKAVEYINTHFKHISKDKERSSNDGIVAFKTNVLRNKAVSIKMTCNTDFVSMSQDFIHRAKTFLSMGLMFAERQKKLDETSVETFLTTVLLEDNLSIRDTLPVLALVFGEKIELTMQFYSTNNLFVVYNHFNKRHASMIEYKYIGQPDTQNTQLLNINFTKDVLVANDLDMLARDVALHAVSLPKHIIETKAVMTADSMLDDYDSFEKAAKDKIEVLNVFRIFL